MSTIYEAFIYFLCNPKYLATVKLEKKNKYFVICTQDSLKDTVNSFPALRPNNLTIQPLLELTENALGKCLNEAFRWLLASEVNEDKIVTIVTFSENTGFLMGVYTSGFLKVPVKIIKADSGLDLVLEVVEDFTISELRSAIDSFNREDFVHGKFMFQELERRSRSAINQQIFQTFLKICDFFLEWDDFDYSGAQKELKDVKTKLKSLERQFKDFVNIRLSLEENKKFLDIVTRIFCGSSKQRKIARSKKVYLSFLLDVLLRGKRLLKLGKYHDASIRFYRVLEGISQHLLLKNLGFSVDKPNYDDICKKLSINREELCKKLEVDSLPPQVPFNLGLSLLRICGDQFAKNLDVKMVNNLQDARNNSLLVHGLNPIKKDRIEKIEKFCESLLRQLFSLNGISFENQYRQAMSLTLKLNSILPTKRKALS